MPGDTGAPQGDNRRKHLDPSELGTKHYWDAAYSRELTNYEEDPDDEGTIWFSESNAEDAILEQLRQLEAHGFLVRGNDGQATADLNASRFLDLGTGNGHLLFAMREDDDNDEHWNGELVGVDYSVTSVELSRRIAQEKGPLAIRFEQWDLLQDNPGSWLGDGFDVVLDKGTFDAISLMQGSKSDRHPCETYAEKVIPLIKPGCFLCITSCNWTKEELLEWLAPAGSSLKFYSEAKYPSFTFGGKTGQSIVTITMRRAAG